MSARMSPPSSATATTRSRRRSARRIAPGPERDVGHLVEGEVERRERIVAAEQPRGVLVVLVVQVLAGQQDTGIEQPERQRWGRVPLTSSATHLRGAWLRPLFR